jgi:hypothetical protein
MGFLAVEPLNATSFQYFFGWPYGDAGTSSALTAGICGAVFAFIPSPFGLPNVMIGILVELVILNDAINRKSLYQEERKP